MANWWSNPGRGTYPQLCQLDHSCADLPVYCRAGQFISAISFPARKQKPASLKLPKLSKTDNYCHKSEKSLISYFSAVWAVGRPSLHQCQPQQRQLYRSRLLQLWSRKCLQFSTVTGRMAFVIIRQALFCIVWVICRN